MAIYLKPAESGLGQGIQTLGNVLGAALQKRGESNRQRLSGDLLNQYLSQLGPNPSATQFGSVMSQALAGGADPSIVKEFGQNLQRFAETERKAPFDVNKLEPIREILSSVMPQAEADRLVKIIPSLSTGGQTQFAQFLFDKLARAGNQDAGFQVKTEMEKLENEATKEEALPQLNLFKETTAKEKNQRENILYKENVSDFKADTVKREAAEAEGRSLSQLERLNDTTTLPRGAFKILNVNTDTGELRFPALASPNAQLWQKVINDFTTKAKDSYGARVTNFELDRFLKRLPTLANSPEGRRVILSQMKAINDLNKLHYDSLRKVYSHYGLRGVDRQNAEDLAEKMSQGEKEILIKQYELAPRAQEIFEAKKALPEGAKLMLYKDKLKYVKDQDVDLGKSKGAYLL